MVRAHFQDFDIELSRPNGHTLRKMEQYACIDRVVTS
jgi:hypothetical protein